MSEARVYLYRMPDLGEGVLECEIQKWLIKPGQEILRDQIIAEVLTDKAVVELPFAEESALIEDIITAEGQTVKVGESMFSFRSESSQVQAEEGSSPVEPTETSDDRAVEDAPEAQASPASPVSLESSWAGGIEADPVNTYITQNHLNMHKLGQSTKSLKITPMVRKLAAEGGVDLNQVEGSGPKGRITVKDLLTYQNKKIDVLAQLVSAERAKIVPLEGDTRKPLVGLRKSIAKEMVMSKRAIPHFHYMEEMDASNLLARKEKDNVDSEIKITFLPYLIQAVVYALQSYPEIHCVVDVNHEFRGDIVYRNQFNIGIAMATPDGLVVPTIFNADKKDIYQISHEILDLRDKAMNKRLKKSDLEGTTFSITSLGALGGVMATPIIPNPEVGILSVHSIRDRVVPINGKVDIRPMMNIVGGFDHRIVDGMEAASFMKLIIDTLSRPLSEKAPWEHANGQDEKVSEE